MGTVSPFAPQQPLAVHGAVLQEAHLYLCVLSFAVSASVLWCRVGAAAGSGFGAIVTRGAALAPVRKVSPASVNCSAAERTYVRVV